jgi:hypothetical protein
MTGPEHYKIAEDLIQKAEAEIQRLPDDPPANPQEALERTLKRGLERQGRTPKGMKPKEMIASAQVHAILAVAAATALGSSGADSRAWNEAAGTTYTDPRPA